MQQLTKNTIKILVYELLIIENIIFQCVPLVNASTLIGGGVDVRNSL